MEIINQANQYFFNIYNRFPIDVDKGRGVYLYAKDGSGYLDFLAGIAVNALGYNHPVLMKALRDQLERNLHLGPYFIQDVQVALAKKLLSLTPFKKVFFTNSGTEAIEGLLKAVKKWGNQNHKNEIIAFEGSFHGRSLGALSITIQKKHQQNFLPLLPNIRVVPFNDVTAFEKTISENTSAVFYEGITGEGGIREVAPEMLKAMERGREKYEYLLVQDEIQTGVGRTGSFYYYEQAGLLPDAIASAKGLGGGLPLGAFFVNGRLKDIFVRGEHGTTYGGNPLACAGGLSVVEIVSNPLFLTDVTQKGKYFKNLLCEFASEFSEIITEVRGTGLMLGIQVRSKAAELMQEAFKQGLIFNIAGGNVLRFVPPLIVTRAEIDEAIEKLHKTFKIIFK